MEVYVIKMSNGRNYTYFSQKSFKKGRAQAQGQCTKSNNNIIRHKDSTYADYWVKVRVSFEVWYADEKDPLSKIEEYNKTELGLNE